MDTDDNELYRLNRTDDYHRQDLETLGWELTVCNSLYPANTPIRRILKQNTSYGDLLYRYLAECIPLDAVAKVMEIGGGYGYLMKDFLGNDPDLKPSMLDISPALLKKQQETLRDHKVEYYLRDALEMENAFFSSFDLVILNENLGDFPALVDIDPVILSENYIPGPDDTVRQVRHFFDVYGLEKPAASFNMNIGAVQMVEKVCRAGIPYIFIGEHSCECLLPSDLKPFFDISWTGNPMRIRLKGHDEFTIKFSYLQEIAGQLGYKAKRGPFADYIVPDINDHVRAILASRGLYSDSEEIIYQFIGDVYEYEYLILMKQ